MANEAHAHAQAQTFTVGFRQKIAITFTLLITFIMLISVYLVTLQIKQTSLKRAEETGRLLGKMIALSMGEDIVRGNFQGIDYALGEFTKNDKVEYCLILDNLGRIISSTKAGMHGKYFSDAWSRSALFSPDMSIRRASDNLRPVYDTSVPIIIGGKRHGSIRAGFTIDEEYEHIRNLLFYNLTLGMVLIVIGVLIAYGISATLLAPLNAILQSVESISRGDYKQKAFVKSSDEFGALALSFNRLSSILQNRETTSNSITKKFLESDPELADKNFSGKVFDAMVLHLELSKFNLFVERNSPSEAVDTLNSFFDQTSEIIGEAGGIVDRFGDGFLTAIFPAGKSDPWPAALRAGFAALSARNNINLFNYKQAQLGLEEVFLKVGLTSGKVIIGHIGSQSRSDFSAIGGSIANARHNADLSNRSNGFVPVADLAFANAARDDLLFKGIESGNDEEDVNHYLLTGFANFAYFRERIKTASTRGNQSIVSAFGLTESSEGFAFLKSAIADENCEYRNEAIRALAPFVFRQNLEVKSYLIEIIKTSLDPQIKSIAISVLALSRDSEHIPLYTELLKHSDDRIRANTVEACIPIEFAGKREMFKNLMADTAPRVCANTLLGLWLADDQQTLACLYGLLKSDNSRMRASAAFAISFLAKARKFRRLFPAYSEQTSLMVLPIVENILKRLVLMLESTEDSERLQALRAIGSIGGTDYRGQIDKLLEDETEPEIINFAHNILHDWDRLLKPGKD
ncbi:MAG: HAMP domain-containing protein [Candidatus Riflebacteria bacterium]|nr:HAMP domain-containing protein [Candidatus Riflebacteria bacterium]